MTNSYLIKWMVTFLQFETPLNVTQYTFTVKGSLNLTIWTDPNVANLSLHSEINLSWPQYIISQNSQSLTLGIKFNLIIFQYLDACILGIAVYSAESLGSFRIFEEF